MKIALITAVFGGIDEVKEVPHQEDVHYKRFVFSESNSPFPLPNLHPRLQAKYFRCQSHRIEQLQEYDMHCWLDGRITVTNPNMLKDFAYSIMGSDIGLGAHPDRNCIYDEAEFIITSEKPYLTERYSNQPIKQEVDYYKAKGHPAHWGLFASGIFIRWNNNRVNQMFDEWWNQCLCWSYFDQTALPFVLRRNKAVIADLGYGKLSDNRYFELGKHKAESA
jgi:hypothetical protein